MAGQSRGFDARTGFLYLRKWTVVAIATGIVAGIGALALIQGIDFFTKLFLVGIVGYAPPLPGGETQICGGSDSVAPIPQTTHAEENGNLKGHTQPALTTCLFTNGLLMKYVRKQRSSRINWLTALSELTN
jgi:hypothetical protein